MQFISLVIYLVKGGNGYIVDLFARMGWQLLHTVCWHTISLDWKPFQKLKEFYLFITLIVYLTLRLVDSVSLFLQEHGKDKTKPQPR